MITVTSFGLVRNARKDDLVERIKHLIPFSWNEIPIKRQPDLRPTQLLPEEKKFLDKAKDFWLLDPEGKTFNSETFYEFCFRASDRHLVVGPAVGFHKSFYQKAKGKMSLSSLTFTHELAQVILAESIYRSACMLKNHPFVK